LPRLTSPSSSSRGPRWARRTGSKTRPWNKPNTTVRTNTLKKVTKTCDVEKPSRTRAIRVVTPPLRTAGPIVATALPALSAELPEDAR